MLRKTRAAGWGLLALAVVVVAVVVTVGALRAHGDAAFNRWVGWATVTALPVAAAGVVLVLWEKIVPSTASGELGIEEIEAELAAVVLAQAQVARSRLIGADQPGDEAANVRFVKGSGRFREVGGAGEGDLATVLTYYQSLSPGRLVVLGEPGAGKTVLALELLIQLLEHRKHYPDIPVPVLISAAAYDTRHEWQEWLAQHLALRFSIGNAVAGRLVRDGRILPVVDGLDEMDPAGGDPERAGALVAAVNASIRGRERAPVVMTCRHREYQVLARGVDRATHIELVPLTGQEAADYLRGQFLSQDEKHRWKPVLAGLDANPGGLLASQLATPWRLTLALAVFRDDGDPAALLPPVPALTSTAAEKYTRRVDRLLLGGYVSSAVRLHELAGRYTLPQVQQWLTALADGLAWQARHNGSATDIRLDQWWQPTGRWATKLIHITLTAVVALPWLIASAASGNLRFLGVAGSFVLVAFVAAFPYPPSRLKLRQIATPGGLGMLAIWLVVGFGLGAGLALATKRQAGLVVGLAVGLATALSIGLVDDSPEAIRPRNVIRANGQYALIIAPMAGFAVGLAIGLANGFTAGVAIGVSIALSYGLEIAANVWTRYHITTMIIAIRQQGPLRFGVFLDWAQQAGLLRVSGVAYQFRHRQLQDWLTSRPITADGTAAQDYDA